MAGVSADAATKEMEALHVTQTPETKVSFFSLNGSMNACPHSFYACVVAASAYFILKCWYMEKITSFFIVIIMVFSSPHL
jgi:hypothetical protein